MNNIKKIEEIMEAHVLMIYNNLLMKDPSSIDEEMVDEIYNQIKNMNKYKKLLLIINTNGGNLVCGSKIVELLHKKFNKYDTIVLDKCASTGTFIILGSDKIYITEEAIITPTDPQMFNYISNSNISTSVIRNYLNISQDELKKTEKLDPILYGEYIAKISFFKKICKESFSKNSDLIIDYMLNKVNNHQMQLTSQDFNEMGIKPEKIPEEIENCMRNEHEMILKFLKNSDNKLEKRYTLIRSLSTTRCLEKKYNEKKEKIIEDYFIVKEEDIMKNNNLRVQDVLNEKAFENNSYKDAYNDSHWDSYNDSYYHDNYGDEYRDYGDNSYYHDSYKDAFVEKQPKKLVKKQNHSNTKK